jgi:uncharacterized protein (DUF1015 family)
MVKITPFKAILPHKNFVDKVSTKSINTYTPAELKEIHNSNKYSFLNVIQPDYFDVVKAKPNSTEKFLKINSKFNTFLSKGIFEESNKAAIFIYTQKKGEKSYTGIIGGASTDDYEVGIIKKHEQTLAKREKVFTKYLKTCGFNAEPVLLTYEKSKSIDEIINNTIASSLPLFNFISENETNHIIWKIDDEIQIQKIQEEFKKINKVYIADGHHRSASSYLFSKEHPENKLASSILSYFVSDEEIEIFDFNRVVKDLNELNLTEFLTKLSVTFNIKKIDSELTKPTQKHEFSMYIEKQYYRLNFKTELLNNTGIIDKLDAQILTNYILHPILGIADLKTNKRINFVSGKHGLNSLKKRIDSNKYKVGFCLHPVSYNELEQIADNDLIMPPKSTWIEPKLRTGLTIYKF